MWWTLSIETLGTFTWRYILTFKFCSTTLFPLLMYAFKFNSTNTYISYQSWYTTTNVKNKNLRENNHASFFLALLGLGGERNNAESQLKGRPAGFICQDPSFWSLQGFTAFPQLFCSCCFSWPQPLQCQKKSFSAVCNKNEYWWNRKEEGEEGKNHVWHKTLAPSFSPLLWLNKSEILWLKKKRYEFKKLDSSSSNSQNENKASAKCTKNFIRPATEWCVNFQDVIRQALYGSAICNIPSCMFSKNDKAPKCVHDIQAGLNVACYHIATEVFYRKTQRCWACKLIQAADLREREYCLTQCTSADVKLAVQSRKWPANKL